MSLVRLDHDPRFAYAITILQDTYGYNVSVDEKKKTLTKYGRSTNLGGSYGSAVTLMTQLTAATQHETYLTTNGIVTVVGDSSTVTGSCVVEGHTMTSLGSMAFVVQYPTLTGSTAVSLATPLARCTRIANLSENEWAGNVYAVEDDTITGGVPSTASKVHAVVPSGRQQTEKSATTISSSDAWILTGAHCTILEKQAAFAEIWLEQRQVQMGTTIVQPVFRPVPQFTQIAVNSQGTASFDVDFDPLVIVPPNSDVRMVGYGDTSGREAAGHMYGYLAKVT